MGKHRKPQAEYEEFEYYVQPTACSRYSSKCPMFMGFFKKICMSRKLLARPATELGMMSGNPLKRCDENSSYSSESSYWGFQHTWRSWKKQFDKFSEFVRLNYPDEVVCALDVKDRNSLTYTRIFTKGGFLPTFVTDDNWRAAWFYVWCLIWNFYKGTSILESFSLPLYHNLAGKGHLI